MVGKRKAERFDVKEFYIYGDYGMCFMLSPRFGRSDDEINIWGHMYEQQINPDLLNGG